MLLGFLSFLVFLVFILLGVAFFTLFERKLLSYSQGRLGPNKSAGLGVLQPSLDGIKLLLKEGVLPLQVFNLSFILFPAIVFPIIFCLWLIPVEVLSFNVSFLLLVFLIGLIGVGVFGVMLAGVVSMSKFGFLGGLRASAQSVSYEIILSLILLGIVFCGMGLSFLGFEFVLFFLFPAWVLVVLSETGRAPLDFSEGESELISGFNTEYSSFIFVLIFLGEYGMVLGFSFLSRSIFFSSSFMAAGLFSLFLLFFRSCYPRLRFDILIGLCWLYLLPISLLFLGQLLFLLG